MIDCAFRKSNGDCHAPKFETVLICNGLGYPACKSSTPIVQFKCWTEDNITHKQIDFKRRDKLTNFLLAQYDQFEKAGIFEYFYGAARVNIRRSLEWMEYQITLYRDNLICQEGFRFTTHHPIYTLEAMVDGWNRIRERIKKLIECEKIKIG